MTRVSWTTLHPSETEAVVSVMLLRESPNAMRVRPSIGDGGIDVIEVTPDGWLVDQIKYFPTNLTSGQKAQVEKSYCEVRRFAASKGARIARWRLVLPLDPTNENRDWFDRFTADAPFPCHWHGLTFLEGLAAKYPEVIDYYLKDGKDRLAALMSHMLAGLGLQHRASAGEALDPIDTVEGLVGIYEALNAHDPHYRYGYSVDLNPPAVPPEPFLVAVTSRGVGEVYVTFRIYARFAQAVEERPVPINLQFRVPADSDVADALQDFHTFGTPVTVEDPTGEMLSWSVDLPGGLGGDLSGGRLRLGAPHPEGAQPYDLRLQILDETGTEVATARLRMEPVTTGATGDGMRATGVEEPGAFGIAIRLNPAHP